MELAVVWMLLLPRRARLICFFIVTPWEVGVILTANYAFLNYLVLSLGFLLLDDRSVRWLIPARVPARFQPRHATTPTPSTPNEVASNPLAGRRFAHTIRLASVAVSALMLTWIAYATTTELIRIPWPEAPLPSEPVTALEPFRIANEYGLFAVMTRGRYEIEFQGSIDGDTWTPYLFRYKPQALNEPPGIYAPYQPRFEWNLWFASLGDWRQSDFVALTEERLLENDPDVLALFRGNPLAHAPPRYVRAVLWQYWFTSMDEKRRTGNWWKRSLMGVYAPVLTREPDGSFVVTEWPGELAPHD
jgi:hypothetical protein